MIIKIKEIPEKKALVIGLTLLLLSSLVFPFSNLTTIMFGGIGYFFSILFILSAADKRHARIGKE